MQQRVAVSLEKALNSISQI